MYIVIFMGFGKADACLANKLKCISLMSEGISPKNVSLLDNILSSIDLFFFFISLTSSFEEIENTLTSFSPVCPNGYRVIDMTQLLN